MVKKGRNLIPAHINMSLTERQGVIFIRSCRYSAVYCYINVSDQTDVTRL
jgi:hypothetical protein